MIAKPARRLPRGWRRRGGLIAPAPTVAPEPTVVPGLPEPSNVESMTVGTGSFESYREIITRGSLRGKMVLASACLSLSQLV